MKFILCVSCFSFLSSKSISPNNVFGIHLIAVFSLLLSSTFFLVSSLLFYPCSHTCIFLSPFLAHSHICSCFHCSHSLLFSRDAPEATGEETEDADLDMPRIYEPVGS